MRGLLHLLRPKLLSGLGRSGEERRVSGRLLLAALVGALTLPLIYLATVRLLQGLRDTPEVGPLLAARLLGFGLLILLAILFLSNLIAALSSFFLSRDLPMVLSAPVDWLSLYGSRLAETAVSSSWMVLILLAPVLVAYQQVYDAGLLFYGLSVLVLVPLMIIPAAAGSAGTLLLMRVFPARRTRDLLGVIAAGGVALVVLGLRVIQPERLMDPEGFRNLVDFLAVLRGPMSLWLPSEWAAETLLGVLRGGLDPFFLLLLWTTAAGLVVVGAALHARLYSRCFTRGQEGTQKRVRWDVVWKRLESWLRPLGLQRAEMILKDTRIFFRDATQWSQLIILGVLVVVYVYNIRVLPLDAREAIGPFLVSVVSFLNMGLTGFVLAAIAARFVFPALSLEGRTLWLLRSSPLPPATFLWSKYWSGAVPLVSLALLLAGLTTLSLGVDGGLTVLHLVTVIGLTLAFTAQALAWGIAYPKMESENAAQIPTSVGGLLFMLGALLSLGLVVATQLWSLQGFLESELPGRISRDPLPRELGAAFLFTVSFCALATVVPYRIARQKLEALDA